MPKGNTKPFVALACICENALQEPDNVLSIIRVVDTVFVEVPPNLPTDAVGAVQLSCVVSLKSGDLVGSFEKLRLRMMSPNGDVKEMTDKPITAVFAGGAGGFNLRIKLTLAIKTFGLAWIDVLWGDDLLTSMPLDVKRSGEAPSQA